MLRGRFAVELGQNQPIALPFAESCASLRTNQCCDALHSQSRYHERGVLRFTTSCPRLAAKSSHIDRAYTSRDLVMPDLGNSEPAKAAPVPLLPTRPSPPGKTDICLSERPLIPNLDNPI